MAEIVLHQDMAAGAARYIPRTDATFRDWIAVLAGALGALMATLDISITNAALPQIQGAVGATGTEGTWISTGYLMAEIVMIPLAAWLSRVFGMRRFLLWNAGLFTLFSIMCGMSNSLPFMIIGRIGQGFTGGAMIPTAQTLVRTRLPPHQMPTGMAIFGLIVIFGPLIGPAVGGWLTENLSWHWCFFVNVPVCAGLIALLTIGLPKQALRWNEFVQADWLGIGGLALGLSTLTVVLEDGQRERWFESPMIISLSIMAALGITMLLVAQRTAIRPVIQLRLLLNRNFASVILIVFTVGSALVCISYLLPQFLAGVAGYNASQSGSVLLLSGVPAVLLMPLLPMLLGKVDPRLMVTVGLLAFAGSCFLDTNLTTQTGQPEFFWSQILRGAGQILAMMPLNQASMAAVAPEDAGDAAGLYNMARNMGGSIGLAVLGIFIDRRNQAHLAHLRESVTANSVMGQEQIGARAANFLATHSDAAHAKLQALGQLLQQIKQQAVVMTYCESFFVLGIALLLCLPLALLLKKSDTGDAYAGH